MIFKFIFSVLRNLRGIISLTLIIGGLALVFFQYQKIKESPLGALLPSLAVPNLQQYLPTESPTGTPTPELTPTPYPSTVKIGIETNNGPVVYSSEVAQTEAAQALGLMYRTKLPQYAGMYFVFQNDSEAGFWMKNCEIPLDILFINAAGYIVDIKENFAPCKTVDPKQANCPTYTPKVPYRTVLEINGGSAKTNNITVGQKVGVVR